MRHSLFIYQIIQFILSFPYQLEFINSVYKLAVPIIWLNFNDFLLRYQFYL